MVPLVLIAELLMTQASGAADSTPIRYTVRFTQPHAHLIDVELIVPTSGRDHIELMMPVWTPGSYLVREYARHVEQLEARSVQSNQPLWVTKVRKNRWSIQTDTSNAVRVSYRVYAHEMAVQGNWVDASFALLNGAATFLTVAEEHNQHPHEVSVELPPSWKQVWTGLPTIPDQAPGHFVAPDFDTLVDCPIYAGNPNVYTFVVDGKPHHLVNEGEAGVWDGPRAARDVEAIVKAQRDFWGSLPYDKYVFINILSETGGGLEHKNSTVLMASRWATRKRASYLAWLNLVSHEYFHTWNVKRLRPVELGPFDYENEVYTPSLWIAEGITSYYDRLFVRRAGLCTVDEVLAGDPPGALSTEDRPKNDLERLHETHGRLVQPLDRASFDAWIKYYRRDENTANTAISYYVKGSVVAWLLDSAIRRATNDTKSLDDVMRLAYQRFAGERGFTHEEFQNLAAEVAGIDLAPFFKKALSTTEDLDYTDALNWFGLRFAKEVSTKPSPFADPDAKKSWLGADTKAEGGRLVVTQVRRDGPAYAAGLNVGDELIAIGELRVSPDGLSKRLSFYQPGEKVSLLIARRDQLMRLDATLGQEPTPEFRFEIDPNASDAQRQHLRLWLGDATTAPKRSSHP
jgi:predicted metalloprotease with PDZ domain